MFGSVFCTYSVDVKFVTVDLKIHNIKQNEIKVGAVRYGQCSETSDCYFFENFVKTLIDRIPLLQ